MKKKWIVLAIAVAAVLAVGAVLWFTGVFQTRISYTDAEAYTAGEADIAGPVKHLDIHWVCGNVTVAAHSGDTVMLREASGRGIGGDLQLRWWLDGDTLRVQYGRDGARVPVNYRKDLTLTLPEGLVLGDADLWVISGDVRIPDLAAESLTARMTTGSADIRADVRNAGVTVKTGNVRLALTGAADEVSVSVTTGAIDVAADRVWLFSADSVTGDIRADLKAATSAQISCTTGNVTASLASFGRLGIGVTTGSVTACLPETPGFTAEVSTVSGGVSCALDAKVYGSTYTCGDGSAQADIHTVTGNITLKALAD